MQLEQAISNLNASEFVKQITLASNVMHKQRDAKSLVGGKVNDGIVEIFDLKKIIVVSDLHGDLHSLFRILSEINYKEFLSDPMNKLVFLGDYVDRGTNSIGVIYSVCYLKSTYPDSVVLMKGNHEAPIEFPFHSHSLLYEIENRFGENGKSIYQNILSMFRLLTLATVIKQDLFLVHGGIPTEGASRESIATAQINHVKNRVLEELLWNDPRELTNDQMWEVSRRGYGRHFGLPITSNALCTFNVKAIIRGHEPCLGFRLDHNNSVITLFSCREAYPRFKAAYLIIDIPGVTIKDAKDLQHCVRFLE